MSYLKKKLGFIPKSLKVIDAKDLYQIFLKEFKDGYTTADRTDKGSVLIARHLISNRDEDGKSLKLPENITNELAAVLRTDGVICQLSPKAAEQTGPVLTPGMCVGLDLSYYNPVQVVLGEYVFQQWPYELITGIYTDEFARENISTDNSGIESLSVN